MPRKPRAATVPDIQPFDPAQPVSDGNWIDKNLALDGQAAAAGDAAAAERLLGRMDEHAPGIADALRASIAADVGGKTTFCPAADPKFVTGYDAIFGPNHDPWGRNKKRGKPPEDN